MRATGTINQGRKRVLPPSKVDMLASDTRKSGRVLKTEEGGQNSSPGRNRESSKKGQGPRLFSENTRKKNPQKVDSKLSKD